MTIHHFMGELCTGLFLNQEQLPGNQWRLQEVVDITRYDVLISEL